MENKQMLEEFLELVQIPVQSRSESWNWCRFPSSPAAKDRLPMC